MVIPALNRVVGHEITHILEGTDLYDSLAMAVAAYAKTKGEYESRLQQIRELYKGKEGYTGEEGANTRFQAELNAEAKFEKEQIADLVGDYLFTDKQFVEKLFNEDRGLFNWIRKQIDYIHSLCKAGSKEARQLEKAKKMFTEVVREASENGVKNPTAEGGVKYSLGNITDVNGKNYGVGVHLDSTLLDNLTPKERVGMVKEYVKELGGDSFTAYDPNGNAEDITIAKANARFRNQRGKKVWANKDLTTKRINNEVKQEAIALVDELITTAEYDTSSTPRYPHDWLDNNGQNDWEYWTTYIQDKNNTIWEVTLNVANSVNGEKILYDISPIKKVGQSVKSVTIPTKNSIRNPSGNVNNQNSSSTPQNSSSTPQNSSSTPGTTSLSAPGQVETAGGGWDVRGQDVGLPMPEGYQEGSTVAADGPVGLPEPGFVGSYTGTTYTPEQASLLASVSLEGIQNATDLAGKRDVSFTDIGISDQLIKQAWVDAGLAYEETNPDGDVYYVVNDAMLMDERERRQKRQKGSMSTQAAQEAGLPGLTWSRQSQQQPSRAKADEDGVSPEAAVRAEQQSLDDEFRRQAGLEEDPSLYDPEEDEGVETTRDQLEVKLKNLQWELKENLLTLNEKKKKAPIQKLQMARTSQQFLKRNFLITVYAILKKIATQEEILWLPISDKMHFHR